MDRTESNVEFEEEERILPDELKGYITTRDRITSRIIELIKEGECVDYVRIRAVSDEDKKRYILYEVHRLPYLNPPKEEKAEARKQGMDVIGGIINRSKYTSSRLNALVAELSDTLLTAGINHVLEDREDSHKKARKSSSDPYTRGLEICPEHVRVKEVCYEQ